MKKILFIIFLFFFYQQLIANVEKEAFFISPKGWKLVNPKTYTEFIKIAFVKNQNAICRPSINLAQEKTILTLDEYTNEAKKNHLTDTKTSYRILSTIELAQGEANLCQINKNVNSYDYQMLQLIFVKDGYAYIMTGACKKNEMLNHYKTYMRAFSSLVVVDNLFSLIEDDEQKKQLLQKYKNLIELAKASNPKLNKKNLLSFENYLDKKFENLGQYFRVLLIKKAYKNVKEA